MFSFNNNTLYAQCGKNKILQKIFLIYRDKNKDRDRDRDRDRE